VSQDSLQDQLVKYLTDVHSQGHAAAEKLSDLLERVADHDLRAIGLAA
jgi:hypothetical protein